MKEFLVYTTARLGVLLACYAVVAGVFLLASGGDTLPLVWPLIVAALLSAVVSGFLLRGPRERFAATVQRRAERASQRVAEVEAEKRG